MTEIAMSVDVITGASYYQLNNQSEIAYFRDKINSENFHVGLYQNETRFLTKDGILVKSSSSDIKETYSLLGLFPDKKDQNYIEFDLGKDHAFIHFSCLDCDNGKMVKNSYDFINKINVNSIKATMIPIHFDLTDNEASFVFSNLTSFVNDKNYKYIPIARDCVGFLRDVALSAGFGKLFNYFADYELIPKIEYKDDNAFLAFKQKYYPYAICEDGDRSKVGEFVESIYGANFRDNWEIISGQKVDFKFAKNNSLIMNRINAAESNFKDSITFLDQNNSLSEEEILRLTSKYVEQFAYIELYHFNTINYFIDMQKFFQKQPFYENIMQYFFNVTDLIFLLENNEEVQINGTVVSDESEF